MAEKPQPVKVLYCPICSLPAEYCEFGPDFEKCKPWLISNAPDLYPHLLKEANEKEGEKVSEQLQSVGISSAAEGAASSAPPGSTVSSKQEDVKRLPGGKIKKKEKQEVVIEKVVRNRRKCITIVKGLDLFGGVVFQELSLVMLRKSLGRNLPPVHQLLRDQLTRSKLMFKETYRMILWNILQRPGLLYLKLPFSSSRMGKRFPLLDARTWCQSRGLGGILKHIDEPVPL
ncbi:translation machinery-associated protein 22 isoform X1 [Gossypium hirsutum]|uniref:Translation machinery-associated protein 22 isoform X1 n=1 Tax=Gossypium hirsutum TaxID=3635 RepID=A0A1U8PXA2_GOSHI|nr:translation machinery-associated protein 22 isoform X1 [Gossypium hirsutum]